MWHVGPSTPSPHCLGLLGLFLFLLWLLTASLRFDTGQGTGSYRGHGGHGDGAGWGWEEVGEGCFPVSVKPLPYSEHFFKSPASNSLLLAQWESTVESLMTNQVSNPPAGFHRSREPDPRPPEPCLLNHVTI